MAPFHSLYAKYYSLYVIIVLLYHPTSSLSIHWSMGTGFFHVLAIVNSAAMNTESKSCSVVSASATAWTVAHQAPLSMEFSRKEYRSG